MTRPEISEFFPDDTTPVSMQKAFIAQPELYRYITALDGYVDWLIDAPNDGAINQRARMLEIYQKSMGANVDELGITKIETEHGDIFLKRSKFLEDDEIVISRIEPDHCPNCKVGILEELPHHYCRNCNWESI